MASSDSMDDSFRLRVDKVFGSLAFSKSSTVQSSLWSITDDEVERKTWRRATDSSDRDETPCSASFDELLKKDRKASRRNSRKETEEDDGDRLSDRDEGERDEWGIRSFIGLDPTLNNEEEEDEYDKVATGRENAGDLLFMSDVNNHGSYLNSHNVLPSPLYGTAKDLRAARIRLKEDEDEDEDEAQKYNSGHTLESEVKEQPVEASEDCGQVRSILKRKNSNVISKSQKRVRFDPGCKSDSEASEKTMGAFLMEDAVSDDGSLLAQNDTRVPDYMLNPSKYTRYSLDSSSEADEVSNAQACMDFLNLVKRLKPSASGLVPEDASADLPKSVTFIPRKKVIDAMPVCLPQACFPVRIAAGEAQHEVSGMDEDESETNVANRSAGFQKPGRKYRTKSRSDDSD